MKPKAKPKPNPNPNWNAACNRHTTTDYDYDYCSECKCLDPKVKVTCQDQHLIGDKHCDPQNNHVGCHFDGGDCCGPKLTGEAARVKYVPNSRATAFNVTSLGCFNMNKW